MVLGTKTLGSVGVQRAPKDVHIPDPWNLRVYYELHNIFGNYEYVTRQKDFVDVIKIKDNMRSAWIILSDLNLCPLKQRMFWGWILRK